MAASGNEVGDELFDSVNRPFRDVPDLLDALMRALAARMPLVAAALRLDGVGTLIVGRLGREINTDWISGGGGGHALRDAKILPIVYAGAAMGELRVAMGASDPDDGLLDHFARHCGYLAKRYEVRRWSERRLGRPLLLVGLSRPIRALEAFLEICAGSKLPVLLHGEFGTEKAQLAATIHCCGPTAAGPFVQIDCAEPGGAPASWLERAEGGTLYLGDVNALDPRLQKQLPQYLPSRLHQWLPAGAGTARVVASTTADLHRRADEGLFSRALLAELDFLTATLPPLRERADDIEPLIWAALERGGYRPAQKCGEALVAACRMHDWPENVFELERTVARLAAMTGSGPIAPDDISRHAPAILPSEEQAVDWAGCAIDGGEALRGLHPALRRALAALGSRYAEPISLGALARHAGVSPSHLGFLFRSVVGMPFKTLLGRIRIRKARELLAAGGGGNITQVAMSVGYSDLSHFERSFRRIVGQSPREFRRSAAD